MSNLFQRFRVVSTDTPHSVLAKARELLTEFKSYLQNIHDFGFAVMPLAQFRLLLTAFISTIQILRSRRRFNSTTGISPTHVLDDLNTNLRELDEYLTNIGQLDNVMEMIPGLTRVLQETSQETAQSTTLLPTGTPVRLTSPAQDTTTTNPPVGTNSYYHMYPSTGTYGGKRRKTRGTRSRKTRGRRSRMNRK